MKAIACKRRRFGYRRIGVLLARKGMIMNHKKLYRLYCEEKLGVKRRRGRKRARGSRTPPLSHASAYVAGQRTPVALRPTSGHTHLLEIKHPLKRVEHLNNLRTTHTIRLLKLKPQNMKSIPANSRYE